MRWAVQNQKRIKDKLKSGRITSQAYAISLGSIAAASEKGGP